MTRNFNINNPEHQFLISNTGTGGENVLVYAKGEMPLIGTQWILITYGEPGIPRQVKVGSTVSAIIKVMSCF